MEAACPGNITTMPTTPYNPRKVQVASVGSRDVPIPSRTVTPERCSDLRSLLQSGCSPVYGEYTIPPHFLSLDPYCSRPYERLTSVCFSTFDFLDWKLYCVPGAKFSGTSSPTYVLHSIPSLFFHHHFFIPPLHARSPSLLGRPQLHSLINTVSQVLRNPPVLPQPPVASSAFSQGSFSRPRPFDFRRFIHEQTRASFTMSEGEKVRTSGDSPREQSLPTVNPAADRKEPPKAALHPAVYVA